MKKFTKIMLRVLPIVLVGLIVVGNVFGIDPNTLSTVTNPPSQGIDGVNKLANNVWGSVLLVLRILAVAAIVIAGIRYMFASANDKADIKKQLIILVVGAVLVFGATFVVEIIYNLTSEAAKAVKN